MCDKNTNGVCAMDGAASEVCTPNSQKCPSKPAYGYVDNSTLAVQPYLDLVHAPNSINHICGAVGQQCAGTLWTRHVELKPSAVLSDISYPTCKLSGVSWVIPDALDSDHILDVRNTTGPSWVAAIVDLVGTSKCKNPDGSSYWDSTAIIVTWDDWGSWYDHVSPQYFVPEALTPIPVSRWDSECR